MKESTVKREMVQAIRMEGGYARRIEDRFSVGMPDTVLIPLGLPVVWVEAKIVTNRIFYPSARQLEEMKRLRIPPHSTSFLVGWREGEYFISPPTTSANVDKCLKRDTYETFTNFLKRAIEEENK